MNHHYMKYLFVLLLFLPTCLMAQNKEEKMPGHITKIPENLGGCLWHPR